jgi:hypothetical protein
MYTTERDHGSRTTVCNDAPFHFLGALAMLLLIAALLASSAAHGLALGDAVAQSALGSPLRVVIPVTAATGDSLQAGCFRLVPVAGGGSAQIVTARVSLERAASAPRLIVTTAKPVNEPAIRFSVEAGCNGSAQRVYVLLLDPPAAGAFTAPVAAAQAAAHEPRPERPAPQPTAARRNLAGPVLGESRVVHLVESPERAAPAGPATPARAAPEREGIAGGMMSTAFHMVAGTPALAALAAAPSRVPPASASTRLWPFVVATLVVGGMLALLGALFVRRRRAMTEIPQWTRSQAASGPRSFADLSAAPVTLPHTNTYAGATTQPGAAQGATPKSAAAVGVETSTAGSRPTVDPSTIDTLLDATDQDIIEERAVREAWAAARSDVEREMDGNAILQAIEAAERDLHLAPPAPAQSAIERALDDDLLQPLRHHASS